MHTFEVTQSPFITSEFPCGCGHRRLRSDQTLVWAPGSCWLRLGLFPPACIGYFGQINTAVWVGGKQQWDWTPGRHTPPTPSPSATPHTHVSTESCEGAKRSAQGRNFYQDDTISAHFLLFSHLIAVSFPCVIRERGSWEWRQWKRHCHEYSILKYTHYKNGQRRSIVSCYFIIIIQCKLMEWFHFFLSDCRLSSCNLDTD